MADQTEQMNRLLDPNSVVREGERDMGAMSLYDPNDPAQNNPMTREQQMEMRKSTQDIMMSDPNSVAREGEIQMITNAQMGLMEMDPEGTKDVVQGLEMTKQKVMGGEGLTQGESSGIMAILEKLGGALKGMMSGGETKSYMVDGKIVEMTEREMMGAKNAGILVQDVESGIRDMEMQQKGFLVDPQEGGTPPVRMPNVTMPDLSEEERMRMRMMRETDPSGMKQLLGGN